MFILRQVAFFSEPYVHFFVGFFSFMDNFSTTGHPLTRLMCEYQLKAYNLIQETRQNLVAVMMRGISRNTENSPALSAESGSSWNETMRENSTGNSGSSILDRKTLQTYENFETGDPKSSGDSDKFPNGADPGITHNISECPSEMTSGMSIMADKHDFETDHGKVDVPASQVHQQLQINDAYDHLTSDEYGQSIGNSSENHEQLFVGISEKLADASLVENVSISSDSNVVKSPPTTSKSYFCSKHADLNREIASKIQSLVDRLETMFLMTYEQLDTNSVADETLRTIRTAVESYFYRQLWAHITALYRFVDHSTNSVNV